MPAASPDIRVGDFAIVDTSRGRQMGEVVQLLKSLICAESEWKPIHHKATPTIWRCACCGKKKELEATINCRAKLAETGIPGVKIVGTESLSMAHAWPSCIAQRQKVRWTCADCKAPYNACTRSPISRCARLARAM